MLYSDHMHTHTHTQCYYINENLYAIGLGMQATTPEAAAVLGVPSEVDEGTCITREMVHHCGVSLSEQHNAGFTSLFVQSALSIYNWAALFYPAAGKLLWLHRHVG